MSLSQEVKSELAEGPFDGDLAIPAAGETAEPIRFDEFREHFIPLGKNDLIRLLADQLKGTPEEQEKFIALCRLIESTFHFESHSCLRELKETYAPLDPDTALVELREVTAEERDDSSTRFLNSFSSILRKANYRPLKRDDIENAVQAATALGLRLQVDFDLFKELHVYVRGDMVDTRDIRSLSTWYRKKTIEVPIYQRLVVMFRLKDANPDDHHASDEHVYLKVFKNIPKTDLDMLLPGSKVRMTLLDQGKILVPTLSGIAMSIFKIVKALAVATLFSAWGIVVFIGLVGGTIGYGVKSFFGYLRTKDKYQLDMTRHLYYQNLDNNAGVFFRILNEAEEQEFREAIVAYYILLQEKSSSGATKEELDLRAEELIQELIGVDVDFEDDDALGKLSRLGLAYEDKDRRWRCRSLDESLRRLDEAWDNFFDYSQGSETLDQGCEHF